MPNIDDRSMQRAGERKRYSRRRLLGGSAAALALAALAALTGPFTRSAGARGWGRHRHGPPPFDDPEAMREHVAEGVEWAAGWLDATDEQEMQLRTIALALADDLTPLAERHRAQHGEFEALMRAPSIDRNELERLRRGTIAMADEASTRLATGFADALDVLTAEQRAKLADHGARRHRWHHRHG